MNINQFLAKNKLMNISDVSKNIDLQCKLIAAKKPKNYILLALDGLHAQQKEANKVYIIAYKRKWKSSFFGRIEFLGRFYFFDNLKSVNAQNIASFLNEKGVINSWDIEVLKDEYNINFEDVIFKKAVTNKGRDLSDLFYANYAG